ncbi:DUF6221 family protein [Nocardia wallacei]|uniref:DUF6221 family protein n=1 Tax=Nocardia wallacei TaxID=480035 RepID=UPI00245854DE|nr:DUF6221 family protein [Nocardia wallacei]
MTIPEALARLERGMAKDEQVARAIDDKQADSGWSAIPWPGNPRHITISPHIGRVFESEAADHITRQDPARTLRRVAAYRKVIAAELRNLESLDGEFGCGHIVSEIAAGECESFKSPILEALASIYPEGEQ